MSTDPILSADAFLRAAGMHPEGLDPRAAADAFREEMTRGLRGESSSLGMFPSYLTGTGAPKAGRVLVIDAGGTNLRLARVRYSPEEGLVPEEIRRRPMPGTGGAVTAEEFFNALAEELLPLLSDCESGCFCFSYPCELRPDGDGRVVRLSKELRISGIEGSLLCAPLEEALKRKGASGERRWRVQNDTVATMLCGIAMTAGAGFADHVGFILGTGANICCRVRPEELVKDSSALSFADDIIVNLESGGFDRFPRGVGDIRLDEKSEHPGQQMGEKIISGAYFPALLWETLTLAAEEGLLSPAAAETLSSRPLSMAEIGDLFADVPLPVALPGEDLAFVTETARLLLERGARLLCAELTAIAESRALPEGSRLCVCADGTTFEKNPLLRPRTEALLAEVCPRVRVEFVRARDATLLGTAYAALTA